MKKHAVFLLCCLITLSVARENPFFPLEEPKKAVENSQKDEATRVPKSEIGVASEVKAPVMKSVPAKRKSRQKEEIANFEHVRIVATEGQMLIDTRDTLIKHFALPGKKAIVMDFKQKADFATIKRRLTTTPFKELRIGAHKGFYRVVIELDAAYAYRISKGSYGYDLSLNKNDAQR